jgi:DHA3 family macrolide efflux protein-like MFS transporter
MSVYSGSFNVVLQTMIEPGALGRVFSIYGSITLLPSMIGLLATGYIADTIGIGNAFVISGAAIGFLGIGAFLVPAVATMVKEELRG